MGDGDPGEAGYCPADAKTTAARRLSRISSILTQWRNAASPISGASTWNRVEWFEGGPKRWPSMRPIDSLVWPIDTLCQLCEIARRRLPRPLSEDAGNPRCRNLARSSNHFEAVCGNRISQLTDWAWLAAHAREEAVWHDRPAHACDRKRLSTWSCHRLVRNPSNRSCGSPLDYPYP